MRAELRRAGGRRLLLKLTDAHAAEHCVELRTLGAGFVRRIQIDTDARARALAGTPQRRRRADLPRQCGGFLNFVAVDRAVAGLGDCSEGRRREARAARACARR